MKRIITYGTFDLLHIGHIRLLKRAKELGSYLIVGLSTDDFNKIKGKQSYMLYEERFEVLSSLKFVDEIIQENCWEQKEFDIKKYDIDCFVIGDDWKDKFDYLQNICEVIYIPRTVNISVVIQKV